jgi:GT2 family glycosyltransferase
MNVCLLIPVYNSTKFLGKLFYHIHLLNPKPDMTFFLENNSKDDTLGYIIRNYKLPYKIIRVFFREDAVKVGTTVYDTIAHVRQLLLTAARQYDPDYAIFLDDDVYPIDTDMISKLTGHGENIVGGTYTRIYPEGIFVASKWGILTDRHKYLLKKQNEVIKPVDMPAITSGGCLCLSRKVIQDRNLDFYPIGDMVASEDYGYCLKARKLGYRIILDNTAKLLHDYIRTTRDEKPWTKKKNKEYVDFRY